MSPAYPQRTTLPARLASDIPPPYGLDVDPQPADDLGYLADLTRDGRKVKALELYPYTVQGPGKNRPPDERRIQLELARRAEGVGRNPPRDRVGVMFGYRTHDIDGTSASPLVVCLAFGTWHNVTTRSSIQFPDRLLSEAELFGAAAFAKPSTALGFPSRAIVLALRVEAFPFFCLELADDFTGPQDWDPASVRRIEDAARRYFTAREGYEIAPTTPAKRALRERVRREVTRPIRDRRFAAEVLRAYGYRCAVCGLQLELVDAAHVDPVENATSSDHVTNGIALCALHHRAYDNGLLHIEPNGMLHLDGARLAVLAQRHLDGGLQDFRDGVSGTARFPANAKLRPDPVNMAARTEFMRRER